MADGAATFEVDLEAPAGLAWCNDDTPGITRRRAGKGFTYRDAKGATVKNPKVLDRIRMLAIPPAWTDVWICPRANGYRKPLF